MNAFFENIIGVDGWWNYNLIKGNQAWRFLIVFVIFLITLALGKIAQAILSGLARKWEEKIGPNIIAVFLEAVSKPANLACFGFGLFVCRSFLVFANPIKPDVIGIDPVIGEYWKRISMAIVATAIAYAVYKLVDAAEYHLVKLTNKTSNKLDNMLVPIVRKSIRVTIVIISALWILDGILEANIRAILLSAGVGGIGIALAAKETIANFFGSITIFADRPFQVDEVVEVEGHLGTIEEVGFRSTRIRTVDGPLVMIPNSTVASTMIKNISKRQYTRRVTSITITYDSGFDKTKRAVEIIKEILAETPEINTNPQTPPRVYFDDFASSSLNIYMAYWVRPADYWVFKEVSDRINFKILKSFDAEGINFAFPTQTIYVKKDSQQ